MPRKIRLPLAPPAPIFTLTDPADTGKPHWLRSCKVMVVLWLVMLELNAGGPASAGAGRSTNHSSNQAEPTI